MTFLVLAKPKCFVHWCSLQEIGDFLQSFISSSDLVKFFRTTFLLALGMYRAKFKRSTIILEYFEWRKSWPVEDAILMDLPKEDWHAKWMSTYPFIIGTDFCSWTNTSHHSFASLPAICVPGAGTICSGLCKQLYLPLVFNLVWHVFRSEPPRIWLWCGLAVPQHKHSAVGIELYDLKLIQIGY